MQLLSYGIGAKLMRSISFVLMMLIASTSTGMAAGLQQLLDSFKKPPTTQPAPTPPTAPAPQAPKQPVKK